jgi:VIT1/CCC1 family predicted Fe2+/Mn2+ transporter
MPEEEEEELALIYQARGLDETRAREFAKSIMRNHDTAVETMAREELGIDPEELGGSAWVAAFTSFVLFSMGAIVPVLPFVFTTGMTAVWLSVACSALALFTVGGAITLFTGRPVLVSGSRQVLFGMVAAALTFGVGRLLGVSLT